eukprot:1101971-Pleurochrysis_carterae.AAC.1
MSAAAAMRQFESPTRMLRTWVPPPFAGGTRGSNGAAAAERLDDPATPTRPTLANTPGVDCCITPASAAAMHATRTPRTTR